MNNEEKILEILVAMRSDISGMQSDISGMRSDISGMRSDISGMQSDISGMQSDISGINGRLDRLEAKVDEIKEDGEITRDGVNTLLDWAEDCSNSLSFPLPKIGTKKAQ